MFYIPLIMPPRRANAWDTNARNIYVITPIPNKEVSNDEFWNVIQMFAQSFAIQNNRWVQAPVNANFGSVVARVCGFVKSNQPEFLGSQIGENTLNFLDEIKNTEDDRVELVSYRFKDVAHL